MDLYGSCHKYNSYSIQPDPILSISEVYSKLKNGTTTRENYSSYYSKHFNLRIGKQQLPWGSGYIWNPTNIFHIKNPLDPTYELTGVNAIKAELLFGQEGMLTGIYSVNNNFKNSVYAIKLKNYLLGFDVSASYVYYEYTNQDLYLFQHLKKLQSKTQEE